MVCRIREPDMDSDSRFLHPWSKHHCGVLSEGEDGITVFFFGAITIFKYYNSPIDTDEKWCYDVDKGGNDK